MLLFSSYRQDAAKSKLPVLNLLTGQKSTFSPVTPTRCTDSRKTWHDQRARGSAWLSGNLPALFLLSNEKSTFCTSRGETLDRFLKFLGADFYDFYD